MFDEVLICVSLRLNNNVSALLYKILYKNMGLSFIHQMTVK